MPSDRIGGVRIVCVNGTICFNRYDPTDLRRLERYNAMKARMKKSLEERKGNTD